MRSTRLPRVTLILVIAMASLVLAAVSASAQWGRQRTSGTALSFAYSGDENGFRLEHSQDQVVYGIGYFDDDDDRGETYCAEIGLKATDVIEGYGGIPFVLGGGFYRLIPDDAELDEVDDFAIWAGAGDFDHVRKGLFYQYRYIFSGPLSGSQGVLGWAF